MTKITFKTLADKYYLSEEDIERIFAYYDTNDMESMKSEIGYCVFCNNSRDNMQFMFDLIRYIKQCEIDKERKEKDDNDGF